MNNNRDGRARASSTKIAYYVQNMSKDEEDIRKIIFAVKSQFHKKDVREFAIKYRYCFNNDDVRHIANLIASIPAKKLDETVNRLLE